MQIESLRLDAFGPFRGTLTLGPFDPGLNILAQPNEWGKTTVTKALFRTLFDRYNSATEEIRQLRPAGSSLSPHVDLVFSAGGERYRLAKGFLDRKGSELFRWAGDKWERTDESDRADQRVRSLIGAPALEGRVAKPETWGMIRYLWARQDSNADWPDWSGTTGDSARKCLAAVEIDHLVRSLGSSLREGSNLVFTATGKVRAGSALETAITECERYRTELESLKGKRAALEQVEMQFARVSAELPVLEQELLQKRQEAAQLQTRAEEVEKLCGRITVLQAEYQQVDGVLQQIKKDEQVLTQLEESQRLIKVERERLETELGRTRADYEQTEQALHRAELEVVAAGERRAQSDREYQRWRTLILWRSEAETLERLERQKARCDAAISRASEIEAKLAVLPKVKPGRLTELRKLDRELREARLRLEAIGLRVTLRPASGAHVTFEGDSGSGALELSASSSETLHAAREVRIALADWGTIEVASASAETAAVQTEILTREKELTSALLALGAGSLAELEAALESARLLEEQAKAAKAEITAHLADSANPAALDQALQTARNAVLRQESLAGITEEERGASGVALRNGEQAARTALDAVITAEKLAQQQVAETRTRLDAIRRTLAEVQSQAAALEARLATIAGQRQIVLERYPTGLPTRLQGVQSEWVRAEARLADARRQMPADADRLPNHSRQATQAASECEADRNRAAVDLNRLRTLLDERGGEGLHTREVELQEKLAWVEAEAARFRREALASRLVAELIDRHDAESRRKVLGPLETRMSSVFANLTGVPGRRVWFDESLQVRGIGQRESELVRYEDLSRGAREQLLLALRSAIALELSGTERQCLLLDDVLVNTDAVRQRNVIEFLRELSSQVQIVLFSCHADRYRGAGRLLTAEYTEDTATAQL